MRFLRGCLFKLHLCRDDIFNGKKKDWEEHCLCEFSIPLQILVYAFLYSLLKIVYVLNIGKILQMTFIVSSIHYRVCLCMNKMSYPLAHTMAVQFLRQIGS